MWKIMRLSIFFLFLGLTQVWAVSAYSQRTRLTLKMDNAKIIDVLDEIENNSEFYFLFNHKMVNVERKVNINVTEKTIDNILGDLFSETDVNYLIKDRQIVLTTFQGESFSDQAKTVSGKVTDPQMFPLPGVTVFLKGTSKGTVTDVDGVYTLTNVPDNAVLLFSFVGMKSKEIAINGQSRIDVVLEEETIGIDEVVAIGYGTQKKVNMTGAITAVKMEELSNISTTNVSNTLAGRAPGVNITGNSGLMGATSDIRIRGGFGEPLFVIDGIVRDKEAFDALEVNEIDQLSFLKDAATASIYGSQAGNGVVLVVTKSGTKQKPMFNYQSSYTFMTPTQELFSDKTTAIDELIYQNRVAEFQGLAIPNGDTEFDYFKDKNYNVNDYIWQTPWNQKHSMSVSGGSDKVTYYALGSYIGEEGSYKNLENDKFNLRSNVTALITDKIKMNVNVSANLQNQKRFYWPFSGDDEQTIGDLYRCTFNWPKTYPFYLYEDGTPANEVTDFPVQTPMGSWQAWNVIDQVIGDRYIRTRKREVNAILSFDIDLGDLLPGLTTKVVGNYIGNDYMRKKYLTYQHNYVWAAANPDENRFIPAAPDPNNMNTFTFSQNQEFLSYDVRTLWSEQLNWFLNYKNSFGKHDIAATVVWEQASNGGEYVYAKGEDPLTNYDQMFVYSTDAERRWGSASEVTGGRLSWIGRFNYTYAQKYIAEFSFRYDGNTLFPKEKRWGFFPSVSAAWRISEESFMDDFSSWLDNLKIRASYGTTGNDLNVNNNEIAPFSYMYVYQSGSSYIWGDNLNLGIEPGATPNPYLTWATSTTYNAGVDFTVLNNKLSGSLEAFYKKEEDILGSRIVTIPDTYGQDLAPENYAARSWRGFELNAMWRDRAFGGAVDYTVYGNIGFSKDQWDVLDQSALYSPGGNLEEFSAIGKPLNRLTGYKTLGIIRTQEQLDDLLASGFTQFGRDPYLGGLYFEDIRGDGYSAGPDGKIDSNDIQVLSDNGAPRINYGFGGSVTWKGITVDAHFQGVGMYDRMVSNLGGYEAGMGGIRQYGGTVRPYYPIWASDVWTPDTPDAKYPRVVGKSWYESGTGNQSFWIRNGAYLRLKNLNIGYAIPQSWISGFKISSAQVFFNGTNLFVLSAMTEFHDPEQDTYDSYPLMKSFTFGLDIKF
ncbi:SusC/RagA family TonB-linked outer membrane protein [Maribellus comscasis]|uniref:SusC/RagA family TonB-linked outer membrane protein n=2 Tax=Maribellus comscasis TaxID=2681766 RepID=A0A6I6K3G7_9BACT|nr:SusC/RagA family TonB-linked outer membrane protein [Maribellus comscasis]